MTAFVLAAVFGAGMLLGFAADGNLGAAPTATVGTEVASGVEVVEPTRRARVYEQVAPTSDQLLVIDSIVREYRARTNLLDEQMTELRAGFRVILVETREAIKEQFTPEQAAEYQRLLDEGDARAAAEREGGGGRD